MSEATLDAVLQRLDALLEHTAATDRRFLPIGAAATYCGLSPESIRRLLSAGKLTALRPVRGKIVIDRREIDAYLLGSTGRPRTGRGLCGRAST